MTYRPALLAIVMIAALGALCVPAAANDHPASATCPASFGTDSSGAVRLACDCLPAGVQSWWPL
ncbi:MAG: hypothetical protein VYE73_09410 [Acidobacteriota bacterium]|nr:hypothetical protein [Acidobacteriota bacterium]